MTIWYTDPDPRFQPAMRQILTISKSNPVIIQTTIDHDYESDIIVRILVPDSFGMSQINDKIGKISVLSDDTFSMDIDTTNYDSFLAPIEPPYNYSTALVIPIGNITSKTNLGLRNVS